MSRARGQNSAELKELVRGKPRTHFFECAGGLAYIALYHLIIKGLPPYAADPKAKGELGSEQPSQNWSGEGESDGRIKTKHCDGVIWCWRNVIWGM